MCVGLQNCLLQLRIVDVVRLRTTVMRASALIYQDTRSYLHDDAAISCLDVKEKRYELRDHRFWRRRPSACAII